MGKQECRRYPPVPGLVQGRAMRFFPPVNADDWCGEYELKPTKSKPTKQVPSVRPRVFEDSTHERIEGQQ